jgi:hypothetical protein
MLPGRSGTFWALGMLDAHQAGDEAFLVQALGFMALGRAVGGTPDGLQEAENWMHVFDLGVTRLERHDLGVTRHLFDSVTGLVVGDYPKVKRSVARVRGLAERYAEVGDGCLSMTHAVALERRWMMGGLRTLFDDARRIQRFAPRGGNHFLDVLTESYLVLEDLASNAPVEARQRVRAAQALLDEGYFTPLHYLTLRAMVWCDLYDGGGEVVREYRDGSKPLGSRRSAATWGGALGRWFGRAGIQRGVSRTASCIRDLRRWGAVASCGGTAMVRERPR